MWFRSILDSFARSPRRRAQRPAVRKRQSRRLFLESLEDRRLLAFDLAVTYAVGDNRWALAAADLDGDGLLDLGPVGSVGIPGINALLGNGDGTFRLAQLLVTGTYSTPIVADLNGDAIDDLVTITDYFELRVQIGLGDDTYQESQTFVLPSQLPPGAGFHPYQSPTLMTLGDLNADGKLDLVAAGYDEELIDEGWDSRRDYYVNVLLGSGDGTFGQISSYYVTSTISSGGWADASVLGVRDFDGDGQADILTTLDAVRLFKGNGDGTLQAPPSSFRGAWTNDVNADGVLDRVDLVYQVFYSGDGPDYTTRHAHVRLGHGDGSFAPAMISDLGRCFGACSGGWGLADFDGDAFPELVVSEFSTAGVPFRFVRVAHNNGVWTPPPPSITISDAAVVEGNTGTRAASFTVTLSAASGLPVTVVYATTSGNATAGSDYQSTSGTLTIHPGLMTGTITVLVNGDRVGEPNETLFVNLSSPTSATIADGQGLGAIIDDEPRISISDVSKFEGKKGRTTLFTFDVTLSVAYDQPVTMSFQTVNGTATTGDNDYVAKTGTLTFAPGETTKSITIEVKGDSKRESDERFYLNLSDASGAQIDDGQGEGTIVNDDSTAQGSRRLRAAAVDAALDDWLSSEPKKRGR